MDSYSSALYAPFQNVGADLILQKNEIVTAPSSVEIRAPFGKALFSDQDLLSISSLENVATIFEQFYLVIIGLVLIISFLVLGKMSLMGLIERQKEIGVLQTVGWCRRDILKQLIAELGVKVIIGCALGVVVSYIFIFLAGAVSVQVHPTGLGDPITISIPLIISPIIVSIYVLLVFIISLLTSYMLGMRIAARKPDENLRSL